MLSVFRKKFGEMTKTVFGRNSENRSSIPVETTVLKMSTRISEPKTGVSTLLNNCGKEKSIDHQGNIIANQHGGDILPRIIGEYFDYPGAEYTLFPVELNAELV